MMSIVKNLLHILDLMGGILSIAKTSFCEEQNVKNDLRENN